MRLNPTAFINRKDCRHEAEKRTHRRKRHRKIYCCELYFEEKEIEAFAEKLENYQEPITYVNRLMTHDWGQKVIRFYDPDGHLIEVGTPMPQINEKP